MQAMKNPVTALIEKLKHNFTVTKPDLIDALVVLFLVWFGWLVMDLWNRPHDPVNLVTMLAVIYFMNRTIYERVFNRTNIPTLETPAILIKDMTRMVKEDCAKKSQETYRVIDVGCGDGQITRSIARAVPQATVLGIEHGKLPYTQCLFFKKLFGIKNADYIRGDFFDYDYRNEDAVLMYLSVQISQKLGEKLFAELKPGALVISHDFELKGPWPVPQTAVRHTPFKSTLYIYRR